MALSSCLGIVSREQKQDGCWAEQPQTLRIEFDVVMGPMTLNQGADAQQALPSCQASIAVACPEAAVSSVHKLQKSLDVLLYSFDCS